MRKPDVWVGEREAMLVRHTLAGLRSAVIAVRMNISQHAVKARQARLRAEGRLPPPPDVPGHWSEGEDVLLAAMLVRAVPKREMARRLGRSVAAIEARLAKLRQAGVAERPGGPFPVEPSRPGEFCWEAPSPVPAPKGPAVPPPPGPMQPTIMPVPKGPAVPPAPLPPLRGCAFPMWPDQGRPTDRYCNAPVREGLPYCEAHARRCYQMRGHAAVAP